MKKILISQRIVENNSYYEIRDCLDIRWASLLNKLNYLPIVLPSNVNLNNYLKNIKIDGIILTGGNDLSIISKKNIDKKRDVLEKKIIDYAIKKNIPLLGVCRGMQIIGYFFKEKINKTENHSSKSHIIYLNKNSIYQKIRNKKTINKKVNSYHNYGFKQISEKFNVVARTKDETIEAIEHKKHKLYGIMWHPERNKQFDNDDIKFIKKIFK